MKPVTAELLAILTSRQFYVVDLWTFTLVGGTVLRYCSGDADVTANGLLYSAGGQVGPYIDRTGNKAKCHWSLGTSVDTLVVDVLPGTATVLGAAFLSAVRSGTFDGAEVLLDRAFMTTYGNTNAGLVRFFVGRVAGIVAGGSVASISINSHLELLNLQFPRNLAQLNCMNNLGDASCTINTNSFKTTGTLTAVAANSLTATLGGSFAAETFDQGVLTFTSGTLNGLTATVKACIISGTTGVITLVGFLPSLPSNGDTFEITYGCNKSYTDSNGCPKFSNTAHFRGFPFTPQPSLAV